MKITLFNLVYATFYASDPIPNSTNSHTEYFTLVFISHTSAALEDECMRTSSNQPHTLLLHKCNEDTVAELQL
jgi:hypothetical protein